MPWKQVRVVQERFKFIQAVQEDPRGNFSRLCASFGISRQQGYKWVARYEASGGAVASLEDRPPVARRCPHATSVEVVDRLVALRKTYPHEGPKKLRARLLALEPEWVLPAASTIGDMLDRHGLIAPRKRRLRVPRSTSPLVEAEAPNDVWCTDFKGHFACGDGVRVHPLTITDNATRFLIKCELLSAPTAKLVMPEFEKAFREFGLPSRIRSDNGAPFASRAPGGLSELSVWWLRLGIVPERIEPGHPEQNGRHERMHRTLKERTASPPAKSVAEQRLRTSAFRGDYNNHRPHEALAQTPPAKHYEPARRSMPAVLGAISYDDDVLLRTITDEGVLKWKGETFFLTRLLARLQVGLREVDDDTFRVHFGPVPLGELVRGHDGWRWIRRVAMP